MEVCRLCLGERPCLNIFNTERSLFRKIQLCSTLQVQENDGLPSRICYGCADTLDLCTNFKFKCEESDRILRRNLNLPIKTEKAILKIEDPLILYDIPEIKEENVSVKEELSNSSDLYYTENNECTSDVEIEIKPNYDLVKGENSPGSDTDNLNRQPGLKKKQTRLGSKNGCKNNVKTRKNTKKEKNDSNLCPYCGMVFKRKYLLQNHIKMHCEKPFTCDVCKKQFHEKGKLVLHIKTHGEKEYPCEICGKLFKTSYDSHRHVQIVHNRARSVECSICGKRLATKFGLKMHLRTHTGEKSFECDICKQKFTFRYTLILHMRTHTGEKPYVCRFCEARFSVQKTLKEHERLHTGETPYCCPVCTKGFSQLSNMKSHFRNNHRGVEFKYKYVKPKLI